MKDKIRETQNVEYSSKDQYSTLTTKGQVTIPAQIREVLNARQGDKIKFSLSEDQQVTIQAVKKDSLLSLFGSMPPKGNVQQESWEEIRKSVKDQMGEAYKSE